MKLIIGLGNPGEKYERTRHNVGFMVLDALASRVNSGQWSVYRKFYSTLYTVHQTLILAKPQTMMNDSGRAVKKLVDFYKIEPDNLYIIHDDLDIALGEYKIQKGKGPREHKGIISIDRALGTRDYWHVRVGIENRKKKFSIFNFQFSNRISGQKYVLQNFTEKEVKIVDGVIDKIVRELVRAFSN